MPISAPLSFVLASPATLLASPASGSGPGHARPEAGEPIASRTYYRPDQDGDLETFQQSARFEAFRQECEDDIDHIVAFAMAAAPHPQMGDVVAAELVHDLQRLKRGLFPTGTSGDVGLGSHRTQLYTDGKPGLERMRACLYDERIPLDTRIARLREATQALGSCSGGVMNGIARTALQLELARDGRLPGAFRRAFHRVLESVLLDGVPAEMGRSQSTHAVQSALNELAPTFGFDPVHDPYLTPLHPTYRALIDTLRTPQGMARLTDMALDALADECQGRFVASLPEGNALRHGGSIDGDCVAKQVMPLLQQDVDKTADALAAHGSLQSTALAGAYGPLEAKDLLRDNDDGTYCLNRDTSLLHLALARNLQDSGVLAELAARPVASWQEATYGGKTATVTLYASGKARWLACGQAPGGPVELGHLDRLQGAEVSDEDFLAVASRIMEGMSAGQLRESRFPGLEPRLASLGPKDADRLPGLMACLRVRADYQRAVIDNPRVSILTRLAWAIELDLDPPSTAGAPAGAPADGQALLRRAVLKGNAGAVQALLGLGVDPGDTARELQFDIGLVGMAPRQRRAYEMLAVRTAPAQYLFDSIARDDAEGVVLALNAGADIDLGNRHGQKPLHAAIEKKSFACAALLIAQGADVNAPAAAGGRTPLELALESRHVATITALLEAGARTVVEDKPKAHLFGWLMYNAGPDQARLAGMMYARTASPADRQMLLDVMLLRPLAPFWQLSEAFCTAIVTEAIRHGDLTPETLGEHAHSSRMLEAVVNHPDPDAALQLVGRMLEGGCRLEGRRAVRALELAAAHGNNALLQLLLDRSNPYVPADAAERIVEAAASNGHEDTVRHLIDHGPWPHHREGLLSAALRGAMRGGQRSMVLALCRGAPAIVVLAALVGHGHMVSARVAIIMEDHVTAARDTLPRDHRLPDLLEQALKTKSDASAFVADLIAELGCGQRCPGDLLVRAIRAGQGAVAEALLRANVRFTADDVAAIAEAQKLDWARRLAGRLEDTGKPRAASLKTLLRHAPDIVATMVENGLDPRSPVSMTKDLLHAVAENGPADLLAQCLAHPSAPCTDVFRARELIRIAARAGNDENVATLLKATLPDGMQPRERAARLRLLVGTGRKSQGNVILTEVLSSTTDRPVQRARLLSRLLDYAPAPEAIAPHLGQVLYLAARVTREDKDEGAALMRRLGACGLPLRGTRCDAFFRAKQLHDWPAVTALLREGVRPLDDREYGYLLGDALTNSGIGASGQQAATEAAVALVETLHRAWQGRNRIVRIFISLFRGKDAWIDFPLPPLHKTASAYAAELRNATVQRRIAELTQPPAPAEAGHHAATVSDPLP